jgi:gluconate 2-dehydrogenase gamma chain
MLSRRGFLGTLTGAGAVWLTADPSLVQAALRDLARNPSGALASLTAIEARALDALTAQILPTDDLPGAREAGIVRFIDRALAGFAQQQLSLYQNGLRDLDAESRRLHPQSKNFADLEGTHQIELMRAMEAAGSPFFETVRVATMTGMFADPSYGGNTGKVGWRLLGFEDRFIWQPPFGDYDR